MRRKRREEIGRRKRKWMRKSVRKQETQRKTDEESGEGVQCIPDLETRRREKAA